MQLTKYTHSCVRFDDGDRTLVLDPGVFSEVAAALDGADAVLITHEHPDHLDVDQLREAGTRNPRLQIWAPAPVAAQLSDLGEQVTVAEPGQAFEAAGFSIRAFGGQHAMIHPSIPVIPNVGYLVADSVFHPGDSFTVPPAAVQVLLAPLHAPWSKLSEVIDFAVSVRAPKVLNLHDVLLTDVGRNMVEGQLGRIAGEFGCEFQHLAPAETLDV
jgi:glyoxylase-like metal-dependent hydrolase (beta-lactamase superfamily II)